jgi:hypothetical protein
MEVHAKGAGFCVHRDNGDKVTIVQRYVGDGDTKQWVATTKFAPNTTQSDANAAMAWALTQIGGL